MITIVRLIILLFPTWFEVHHDRNGDKHPNHDWVFRGLMCLIVGSLLGFLSNKHDHSTTHVLLAGSKYTAASILLFTGVFPYWINFVHLKNGVTTYIKIPKLHLYRYKYLSFKEVLDHIVNHLSDTAWPDKTKWWRSFGWFGRLIVYLICIACAITLVL